ncbi:MAG: AbrB family transcriptional regulator [Sphingomonadales bacterium]|nr:AbrB family transcriptional regulator [Sphingomonadales bacterium]
MGPGDWPAYRRWALLLALSLIFTGGLELIRIPAALLLGPMLGAVLMAMRGGTVHIARPLFYLAQGCVGVMIASNLPAAVLPVIAARWPIFLVATLSTLVAAGALGWSLARSGLLPGTTAIWGSSPGAATAMTLMCEDYGADMRLVAFMQYLRVACCASLAALVARFLGVPVGHPVAVVSAAFDTRGFILTLAIILLGSMAGVRAKIPAGAMLVPMVIGMAVKLAGPVMPDWAMLVLPTPFLALCYAIVGWGIGNRFSPDVVAYAARALPRVLGSILALMLLCAGMAAVLVRVAGVDPLTAYLATSPGGADSVSIIATATRVDVPFVIAMQVARFFLVLLTGPMLARHLSGPAREQSAR